jgi:hypothetical protein
MSAPFLAAIVYGPQDEIDALLGEFADRVKQRGPRVAGLVQVDTGEDACIVGDMSLREVDSGRIVSICQDLGPHAKVCRLDPQGLAQAAGLLGEALARDPQLVVINKFGKAEMEGGGLVAEIGTCVAHEIPLAIGVPRRFLAAWDAYAEGMDAKLPPRLEALEEWWASVAQPLASA